MMKKGKFGKVLIGFSVFGLLACSVAFNDEKTTAGIVAVIMTVLFVSSYLMGRGIIKEPKKGVRLLSAIIAFVLVIPYFNLYSADINRAKKFNWNDIVLHEIIPEPASDIGEIFLNSDLSLSIDIHKISQSEYSKYVYECKAFGYNIDIIKDDNSFSAYSKEGFYLSISYNQKNIMDINLDAPIEMNYFEWPQSGVAKLVPLPQSDIGKIEWENSEGFLIKVGNTKIEDYKAYVEKCSDSGFDVDYQKDEKQYYAYDSNGNYICVEYEGNNIMSIMVEAKGMKKEKESSPPTKKEEKILNDEKAESDAGDNSSAILNEATNEENSDPQEILPELTQESEEAYVEEVVQEDKGPIVYTTPTGKKYHYSSSCAGENAIENNLSDVELYYDPCKKCAQ